MSVETILLDFRVLGCTDSDIYIRDVATVATCVAESLKQDCLEQGCISSAFSYSSIYSGPKDCMFTIKHYFREGLITLSLEYFKINADDALFPDYSSVEALKVLIIKNLDADGGNSLPALKRCLPKTPYLTTSDKRIVEYKYEKLLFSEQTPWQLVEIYSTPDFGNMLVLDGYVNLAESDTVYTHNLMCKGSISYKEKDVLILGGGDGALLWELFQEKEKPKFVTMVDIDEAVIRSCRELMPSVSGGIMEKLEGENYKIVIDDAFKWLKTYKSEGRMFDFVFGDLTDIPVHEGGGTWDFVRSILFQALSILPIGGQYLTHCNGIHAKKSLHLFEELLNSLGVPLEFKTTKAFVPSFMETWVFYQVTKTGEAKAQPSEQKDSTESKSEPSKESKDNKDKDSKESKESPATQDKKEKKDDKKEPKSPEKKEDKKEAKSPEKKGVKGAKESVEGVKGSKESLDGAGKKNKKK